MTESEPEPRVSSYVLYRSENGKKYHRTPTCAADPDVPPGLDAAHSLLENVEMARVGDEAVTPEKLCPTCASDLITELE